MFSSVRAQIGALLCLSLLAPAAQAQHSAERNGMMSLGTEDVVLPAGYVIEPVLTGLTYPSAMTFGPDGALYIAEAGHSYGQHWAESRIIRWQPGGRAGAIAYGFRGPVTGLTFRGDQLYVSHRGTVSMVDLSTVDRSRRRRDIVTGLPVLPNSSHFNSQVAFGPDGKMYFAVGTVTNSGVPGLDDLLFGWLPDFPWMRDAPARDVTLTGENYPSLDVLAPDALGKPSFVRGGAFLPFGTRSKPGQVIRAHRRPTGAIYRCNPDGSGLEVYASGIRSPFGFAYGPDGKLYMTNNAEDDKGARAVSNAPDSLFVIREGAWYGWPDFVAGAPVTEERFKPRLKTSRRPDFVMRDHPQPEQPVVRFDPHAADCNFDWSKSDRFGFAGQMFVAEFGDGSPLNTALRKIPHQGFRVVRVDMGAGRFEPFLSMNHPGMENTRGPKRPIDVKFDPSGDSLYLLDFGVVTVRLALDQVGIKPLPYTGSVWRIRRVGSPVPAGGATGEGVTQVEGGHLLSWWTVRTQVLGIQSDIRAAIRHAELARGTANEMQHTRHLEEARDFLDGIRTRAMLALKRIDEPDVVDNGTKVLLITTRDWAAGRNLHNPLALYPDDPVVVEVNRWVEENGFPEKSYLRENYAVPGRWQRPLEKDILP